MGEFDRFDGVEGLQLCTRCDVDGCVDEVDNATNMVAHAGVGPGHSYARRIKLGRTLE
jgi:hypothetical protein